MSRDVGDPGSGPPPAADHSPGDHRQATLANAVADGLFQVNADGQFVAVNDAFLDLAGCSRADLLGEPLERAFPSAAAERLSAARRGLAGSDADVATLPVVLPTDDDERTHEVRLRPVDGTDGGVAGSVRPTDPGRGDHAATGDDTLDRTEARLHEEAAKFRSLVDAVEEYAIFLLDPDGRITTWNEGAARIKGYDTDDVLGEHLSLFYTEEDRAAGVPEANLQAAAETGTAEDEGWRVRADGSRFWANVTITAVHDDDGDLTGYVKVTRDMTERRERERTLQRERDLVEQILEATPVGVAVLDASGDVTRINEAAADVLGIDPAEITGLDPGDWAVFDEDGDRVPPAEWPQSRALRTGESVFDWRCELEGQDGERRWLSANAVPLFDDAGDVERVVLTANDISTLKEREAALRSERDLVETVVEVSPVMIGVFDAETRDLLRANARAAEFLGAEEVAPGEYEYVAGEVPLYDEDGEPVPPAERPYARAIETGQTVEDWQGQMENAEGERRWFSINATPIFEDGEVERVVVVGDDVTQLKEQARALARERDELATELEDVLGRVSDAFFALDSDWRFTYLNDRAEQLLDCREEAVLGETIWEEYPETVGTTFETEYRRALETQQPVSFEEYYPPLEAWFEVNAYPSETGLSVYFRDVTERKERERELVRYETLFEGSKDVNVVVDTAGTFEYVSPSATNVFGYEPEELVGEVGFEYIHPDDREEAMAEFARMIENPEYEPTVEFRFEHSDGSWIVLEALARNMMDDPDIEGIVIYTRDVTERKEREQQLEQYRAVAQASSDAIVVIDEDSTIVSANPAVAAILGYDPADLEGESITTLMSDSMGDAHREAVARYLQTSEKTVNWDNVELPGRHRDGHEVPLSVSINEFEHAGDRYFAGVIRDVTERREMERQLRESEAKFRMLAEHLEEVVWMATPDAEEFVYINPAFEDVWGLDREELYEEPLSFLDSVHSDDRERVREAFADLPDGEFEEEFRIVRPDGEVRWIYARGSEVYDEAAETTRVVGIGKDITERKERERALEESERRYRTLAEHFPNGAVGVYDHDLRYTLTAGSEIGETLPGANQLEGERFPDVFPEHTVADLEPMYRAAVEDGVTDSTVTEFGGRDWRVWATPLRDAAGEIFAGLSFAQDITERKEHERKLHESEERLRLALEAAEMGVWELDLRTEASPTRTPQHDRIFGYEEPIDDWSFERFLEHVHPDDRERVERSFEEAFETGEWTLECRIERADGEVRWIMAHSEFYYDDGEPVRAVGVVQDVTERKERNRELERTLDLLERTETIADVGGWEIDTTTRDVFWSDHIFELLEVSGDEEPPLEKALAMYHEADQPVVEAAVEDALTAGDPFDVEARIRTESGDVRWLRLRGVPEIADGEVVSLRGAAQDITERKERERELEEYETIVETVDDGIYVVDEDGRYTMVNEEYASMAGYDPEELIGTHVTEVVDEEVARQARQLEAGLVSGERDSASLEAELEGEDGEPIVAEATFALLESDDGDYERIGVVRDVTERKERERALEESERRYRTLAENFPDGVVALYDEDLRYTAVGGQLLDQVGVEPDDALGDLVTERYPDDLVTRVEPHFRAALDGEETSFEVELYGRSLLAHALPVRDADDEVFAGMLVVQDVTELRERERELQTRVSQQEAVTDLGQQALEEQDLDALFDEVTDRVAAVLDADYCKVLELLPGGEEVLLRSGVGWQDGLVGEATVGTGLDSQAGYTLRTEKPVVVDDLATETRFSGPDLLVDHDVTSGISVVIGTPEDPWGVLGVHTTARREFSEHDVNFVQSVATILATAIQRGERERDLERYETIVETIWDGVYALDPDGNFELVNDAFASMLGYEPDELLGEPASVVHSEEISATASRLAEEIVEGDREAATMEVELVTADGDAVPVETRFGPYPYDEERYGRTGVSRDVTERLERQRALERQREELAALNRLNQVVGEITHAAVESSNREEIEELVCERLADSESYRFAWIGELDRPSGTVSLSTEAGVEGYLDGIEVAVDSGETAEGPTARAIRTGEIQVTQDVLSDPDYEPWQEKAREYGFRSSAAIPITYEDVLYGVLNVYSERVGAFDGYERRLLSRLGNLIGHTINALERKEALMSDQVVEIEVEIPNVVSYADGPLPTDGTISLDRTVSVGGDTFLEYGTADEAGLEILEGLVESAPSWEELSILDERFGETSFELRLSEPPAISTVASYGGRVQEATIEDGDYRMTVELPPTADVRAVVEGLQTAYPDMQLVAQRRTTRESWSAGRIEDVLEERLTDRQRATMETAYYAGYFDTPRRRSGEEVAESLGISAPTLHQHLRKGQRKLLAAVLDGRE